MPNRAPASATSAREDHMRAGESLGALSAVKHGPPEPPSTSVPRDVCAPPRRHNVRRVEPAPRNAGHRGVRCSFLRRFRPVPESASRDGAPSAGTVRRRRSAGGAGSSAAATHLHSLSTTSLVSMNAETIWLATSSSSVRAFAIAAASVALLWVLCLITSCPRPRGAWRAGPWSPTSRKSTGDRRPAGHTTPSPSG